jgi:hypothetical protein
MMNQSETPHLLGGIISARDPRGIANDREGAGLCDPSNSCQRYINPQNGPSGVPRQSALGTAPNIEKKSVWRKPVWGNIGHQPICCLSSARRQHLLRQSVDRRNANEVVEESSFRSLRHQ